MNPYDIDIEKLKESKRITDERDILKLKLANEFVKATSKMTSRKVQEKTGLDKSDLSRLKVHDIERFSIDRLIGLLSDLGYSTSIKVTPKKAS